MKKWTRKAAIDRMNANEDLSKVYERYPLAREIVKSALKVKKYPGYHRISTYMAYKQWLEAVTCSANQPLWDAALSTIDDILPPDDSDLENENGSCKSSFNPPLPDLPLMPERDRDPDLDTHFYEFKDLDKLAKKDDKRHAEMKKMLEKILSAKEAGNSRRNSTKHEIIDYLDWHDDEPKRIPEIRSSDRLWKKWYTPEEFKKIIEDMEQEGLIKRVENQAGERTSRYTIPDQFQMTLTSDAGNAVSRPDAVEDLPQTLLVSGQHDTPAREVLGKQQERLQQIESHLNELYGLYKDVQTDVQFDNAVFGDIEELRAENEELQAENERLRAAIEELKNPESDTNTSNRELWLREIGVKLSEMTMLRWERDKSEKEYDYGHPALDKTQRDLQKKSDEMKEVLSKMHTQTLFTKWVAEYECYALMKD